MNNKNKQLNILFDPSIFKNWNNKNSGRSGIYFASINILKHLLKNSDVTITFYCKNIV